MRSPKYPSITALALALTVAAFGCGAPASPDDAEARSAVTWAGPGSNMVDGTQLSGPSTEQEQNAADSRLAELAIDLVEVPLTLKPYATVARPHAIDAGRVPSRFAHTWALDLEGIDAFRMHFDSAREIQLSFSSGDRLVVVDACGRAVQTYSTFRSVQVDYADLTATPCARNGAGPRRIYLVLETSAQPATRRFKLASLRNARINNGSEVATVVEDDVRYDGTQPIAEYVDRNGRSVQLSPPWFSGGPQSTGGMIPPVPRSAGWFLVGKNVTNPNDGFYTLLYYNELEGTLRLYLYNLSLSQTVTGHQVSLGLQSNVPGQGWLDLDGAFFPVDPNPKNWGKAKFLLVDWSQDKWTNVDVPMLYPTVKTNPQSLGLPALANGAHNWPIYESPLQAGASLMRFRVEVRGYQLGRSEQNMVGSAIGEAIEKLGNEPAGALGVVKAVAAGMKQGKGWYGSAKKFHDKVDGFYQQHKNDGWAATSDIGNVLSKGAAGIAPFLGGAGVALGFVNSLIGKPKPLRLAIELSLKGKITGTTITEIVSRGSSIYLPGRFSILEASNPCQSASCPGVGLPLDNQAFIDSVLPRYDRAMGLFGYQYDPSEVKFSVATSGRYNPGDLTAFVFPAKSPQSGATYSPDQPPQLPANEGAAIVHHRSAVSKPRVRTLLPVIQNPYVALEVFDPELPGSVTPTESIEVDPSVDSRTKWTHFNASAARVNVFPKSDAAYTDWGIYVAPYIDAVEGFQLDLRTSVQPRRASTFTDIENVQAVEKDQAYVSDAQGTSTPDCCWTPVGQPAPLGHCARKGNHFAQFRELSDVVYTWQVRYAVARRGGNIVSGNGRTVSGYDIDVRSVELSAPVMINVVQYERVGHGAQHGRVTEVLVPSSMLLEDETGSIQNAATSGGVASQSSALSTQVAATSNVTPGSAACADVSASPLLSFAGAVSGFELSGSNAGYSGRTASCVASSAMAPESVHTFTAPFAGTWRFHTRGSSFDTVLSVLDSCQGTSLGCNDDIPGSRQSGLELDLAANQTVYVAVDGYNGSATGEYQLAVEPVGTCAALDDVSSVGVPDGQAVLVSETTSGRSGNVSATCAPTALSADVAYAFTAPVSGTWRFDTSGSGFDTVLSVLAGCGTGQALACNDDVGGGDRSSALELELAAGTTVSVVVDGYNGASGAFDLRIQRVR